MAMICNKINNWLHPLLLRYQSCQFKRKNRRVRAKHPELYVLHDAFDVEAHKKLWSKLIPGEVDPSWYIMHANIAGNNDVRYVPEHVYFPYIEPILNDLEFASSIADKNRLQEFVPIENAPQVVLRYLREEFYSESFMPLKDVAVDSLLENEVELVIKPSVDSSGGSGVRHWVRNKDGEINAALLRAYGKTPLVIQRKIRQHDQSARFNSDSVNTCRIMTLRCPWNGEVVLLKAMLRIGGGKGICDNMMLGGLCLGVCDDGALAKYAYDYDGGRYETHPATGLTFEKQRLELFPQMVEFAKCVAKKVPYMNILSFDLVADEAGRPICLEMNTAGQGITQLQYDGIPLFREYTDNVIEYCRQHRELNKFRHFRTFYW